MRDLRKISFDGQYELDVVKTERGPRVVLTVYEDSESMERGDYLVRLFFDEDALKELISHLRWALREIKKMKEAP